MRLLLDTQVVLWTLSGERDLSEAAIRTIADADDVVMSVVSYAEIGVKAAVGKLRIPDDLHDRVTSAGVRTLGLSPGHALEVARLPLHHRDPFDRLIVAQARTEGLTLVTADGRLGAYDVPLVAA